MTFKHIFKAALNWKLEKNLESEQARFYTKSHTITIADKPVLNVSAAKAFKGNPNLYNPEDLLLSSLISCHMMSYLYVCEKNNIVVLNYSDTAQASLEVAADGSGRFTEARLYPKVQIANPHQKELALALHTEARKLCFIANSCNFPIAHFPSCDVL